MALEKGFLFCGNQFYVWKLLCEDRPQISTSSGSAVNSVWLSTYHWHHDVQGYSNLWLYMFFSLETLCCITHLNYVHAAGDYFSWMACPVLFSFSSLDQSASKDGLSDKSNPQCPAIWSQNEFRRLKEAIVRSRSWEVWGHSLKRICNTAPFLELHPFVLFLRSLACGICLNWACGGYHLGPVKCRLPLVSLAN